MSDDTTKRQTVRNCVAARVVTRYYGVTLAGGCDYCRRGWTGGAVPLCTRQHNQGPALRRTAARRFFLLFFFCWRRSAVPGRESGRRTALLAPAAVPVLIGCAGTMLRNVLCVAAAAAAWMLAGVLLPTASTWRRGAWGVLGAYLVTFFDGAGKTAKGREWPAFKRLAVWKYVVKLVAPKFLRASDGGIKQYGQYVFSIHPHGVISASHFALMTVRARGGVQYCLALQ